MLEYPCRLEDLVQREPVNIDGLVSRGLPLDARGRLRVAVSQALSKTLHSAGLLDYDGAEKSDAVVVIALDAEQVPGWKLWVVNNGPTTQASCFLQGEGLIQERSAGFLIRSSQVAAVGGLALLRGEVKSVSSSDFYFRNPHFEGQDR